MKKFLALLLAVLMVVGMAPVSVFAAEAEETTSDVVYGFYGNNNIWSQDANEKDGHVSYNEGSIELWKTAEKTEEENQYKVTLGVKTATKVETVAEDAAVVLVIDVSGSMDSCAECGDSSISDVLLVSIHKGNCKHAGFCQMTVKTEQTRIYAAKQAAKNFVENFAKNASGKNRMVSVVAFASSGTVVLDWTNVATSDGKNAVENAINKLNANGGTNLDAGLKEAKNQIDKSTVRQNLSAVVLTDGVPTYDTESHGNGSDCNERIIETTKKSAEELRGVSSVYTVCYGAKGETCYGNLTVDNFLKDSVATADKAYNAANSSELNTAFGNITSSIIVGSTGNGAFVTDPMGEVVASATCTKYNTFNWQLVESDAAVDNGSYTYTTSYTVTLKTDGSVQPGDNGYFPLNGKTFLTIDGVNYEFPVPAVKPTYTVTYVQGEHGTLNDANGETSVSTSGLNYGGMTPTAPGVTAADGFEFTGWSPKWEDIVTKSITYTAQYEEKAVEKIPVTVTITGLQKTVFYNGEEQTAEGYTATSDNDQYDLKNVTTNASAIAKGTEIGDYLMNLTSDDFENTDPNFEVTFVVNDGHLTIKPIASEIVITANSASKVYDGTELTDNGYTYTQGILLEGDVLTAVVEGSVVNAGTVENKVVSFKVMCGDVDVTESYSFANPVNGTLTVTPRTVTITSGSASKNFDGKALTCDKITVTGDGFAEGEGAVCNVTGTQTEVGSSKNTFTVQLNKNTLAENYTVEQVEGTLTVNPAIDSPKTGDNANLALYVGLMVVSAAAILFLLFNGKKKGKYSA